MGKEPHSESSERWTRQLLSNLTDVVVVFDTEGQIQWVTPSIEALTGIPLDRHVGTGAFDDVHPDDAERVLAALTELVEHPDAEVRITFRLRRADDELRWVEATARNCVDDPDVGGIVATLHDVTELKQAEELFRTLVDAAPDATVVVDEDGTIVLANERAEFMFAWPAADLVGCPIEVLVPHRLRDLHAEYRSSFVAAPRARAMGQGLELDGLRRDGSVVPVEISLSPLDTPRGRLVSASIRDATHQRDAKRADEAALRGEQELVRKLEEADHLRGEFVSTVAHELRNPLTVISGFAHVLQGMLDDAPDARDMAERITANSKRLLDMIEQLLRFSQLQGDSTRLERTTTALEPIVEQSLELLGTDRLDEHDVVIDIPPGLQVFADADGIANVLRNLVSNAIKFGPRASTVTISAIEALEHVTVSVIDEGPGVPPAARALIFDQFNQTTDGKRHGGTGLGLSIAQRYVELHGGSIGVSQADGGGARFWFTVPHR